MTASNNGRRYVAQRIGSRISTVVLLGLASLFWAAEGRAQVSTYVGNFAAATSGPPNQTIVGPPFQPKAVIFFWTTQTASGFGDNVAAGYGFTTGVGLERVVAYAVTHNWTAPGDSKRWQSSTRCIAFFTPNGTVDGQGHLNSMDASGFTINWDVKPSVNYIVHYMAIGGIDITNQTVGEFTPSPGTGFESVTGTGFRPEFLMFLSIDSNTTDISLDDGRLSIGFAGLSGGPVITQGAISAAARTTGQTNVTSVWQRNDRAILEKTHQVGGAGNTFEAEVTAFDPNGFTINKGVNAGGTETRVHYLALEGGQYKMGGITKPAIAVPPNPTYTDTQAQTAVGFAPKGLLFFSKNTAATLGANENARISFGAADSEHSPLNQEATFFEDHVDNPTSDDGLRAVPPYDITFARQGTSSLKAFVLAQAGDCYPLIMPAPNRLDTNPDCINGPDAGGVRVTAEVNVKRYHADGFTLDWTRNETVNLNWAASEATTEIIYVAFGNDETTTAIELLTFEATGLDGVVELTWETGSEVDNVGFFLYRAVSEDGPYQLVNPNVIPGLGSSPLGARYRYVDSGLVNGQTYFYQLEDLESTGKRERHGPVSATPQAGASTGGTDDDSDDAPASDPRITYGDPEATFLRVLKEDSREVVLELTTGGFYAVTQPDGSVLLEVPDFLGEWEPGTPAIPVKRAWVEALAGKQVRIASVQAEQVEASSLRPSSADFVEPVMSWQGSVRLARRPQAPGPAFQGRGLYPEEPARLVSVAFQQEWKKALVELAPLRWDRSTSQLLLARRLVVRLVFEGRAAEETSFGGSRGRSLRDDRSFAASGNVVAHLVTDKSGLYRVRFEEIFGPLGRAVKTGRLRLS
jgi:hypothetical protein